MKERMNNRKEALFVCTSQYQIFNAIILARDFNNKELQSDILIIDYGNDVSKQVDVDGLKKSFQDVVIYKSKASKNKSFRRYAQNIIRLIGRYTFGMDPNNKYDKVFISGTEMNSKIVAFHFIRSDADLFYLEDGLESYDSVLNKESKFKQDTILKVLYGNRALDVCKGLYVHIPNCVIENSFQKPIFQIPKLDSSLDLTNIKAAFSSVVRKFQKKYIFLNAWFDNESMYQEQIEYINILKHIRNEEYSVKRHPNELNKKKYCEFIYEDCGNFEVANCQYDMSDKIMISIISTACITPIILFNRAMKVVFLYKIFLKKFHIDEWCKTDVVLRQLIDESGMRDRVYIPESIEEYKDILKRI